MARKSPASKKSSSANSSKSKQEALVSEPSEVKVGVESEQEEQSSELLQADDGDEGQVVTKVAPKQSRLNVSLSSALYERLKAQAEEEGIDLEEYVRELLAESVTLRAFEIVERRFQMRGGSAGPQGNNRSNPNSNQNPNNHNHRNNHHNNNNQRRGDRNQRRGGMSQSRYQNIMDDKATFLEYVRNQERLQR